MSTRPSAGAEIQQLLEALDAEDEMTRESAVARLAIIGSRAMEHLLRKYPAVSARVRGGVLRVFETTADPRALPLALQACRDESWDVCRPAIGILRELLRSPAPAVARDALDGLVAAALDTARPADVRLAALDALSDLPADVRGPLDRKLAADPDPHVRARVAPPTDSAPRDDADGWRDAVEGRLPGSPDALKQALDRQRSTARLAELQHLVDHVRAREQRETDGRRREEWRAVRGAIHQALAVRNSRLALYDLRDSLLDEGRLPVTFLAALEEIGDATCLDTLAAAYEASSRTGDTWWREHVAAAFRAIIQREGLTRRHAAVKRTMARWPDATADLMARI